MHRLLTIWLVISVLVTAGRKAAADQAASIPLSLSIGVAPAEINSGDTARLLVHLRNYRGDPIAAPEDVTITLRSELTPDTTLLLRAGKFIAHADVRFQRPGVATIVASAPNLTKGVTTLVVKAPRPALVAPVEASATAAPPPAAGAASGAHVRTHLLSVDVLPEHIHPTNASWQAKILVSAVNDRRQPVAVPVSTAIQLATDIGVIAPSTATIEAGHARIGEAIQLTSTRPGEGTVWAWTDTGELGRATFEYHEPLPTQLAVKALPTRTLNDGHTSIRIDIFLEDDTSMPTKATTDIEVNLTASVGTPTPSIIAIPKGRFVGEALITSATAGLSEITATAAGMKSAVAEVEFVFPYALVLVAGIGGLVGALVRSRRVTFAGAWMWHLADSVAIGSVMGLVFYLLAVFGIVASIPALPIPIEQLPTTNEFAALLIGFFGGYYARAWVPTPDRHRPTESTVHPSSPVSA